jgi:hypothetical protein
LQFEPLGDGSWSGGGLCGDVCRHETSGGGGAEIAGLVANTADSGATALNSTTYYYVVTTHNILGEESGYSAEVAAHPAGTAPPRSGFWEISILS